MLKDMNKETIIVPKGIRYLSQWSEFQLPNFPCIINKQITGCGFTEFCLESPQNIILCSPRKILLENKESQHKGEVYYVKNNLEISTKFEKDLNRNKLDPEDKVDPKEAAEEIRRIKQGVLNYIERCITLNVPCKILVTYDSFRLVKDVILKMTEDGRLSGIDDFHVVVDEWQAIFVDSTFKSGTEVDFVYQLQGLNNVSFVSATPMIDKYLAMLDEFKGLPYYELDWKTAEPTRVNKPFLEVHPCSKSITAIAVDIIDKYRKNEGEVFALNIDGYIHEIRSKEAVFYVNSVKNICDIIRKAELTLEETNVLCSKDSNNNKLIKAAFGIRGKMNVLGDVPLKGQPHKMFTLCTRTVYLGADFYSTNAKSFIFSDANIDCLTVDITLDLPQILGRQRLECNPWKNRAELYYKTLSEDRRKTAEEIYKRIEDKEEKTLSLLRSYGRALDKDKINLAKSYLYIAKTANYREDYIAVNVHAGNNLVPVFNNLVKIAELRNYEIQQVDYKDRFSVFGAMDENNEVVVSEVDKFMETLEDYKGFPAKMKFIYEAELQSPMIDLVLERLPMEYGNFYRTVSPEQAKRLSYRKGELDKRYDKAKTNQSVDMDVLKSLIISEFPLNSKHTKQNIKEKLGEIYNLAGLLKTPKASDLEEYFDLKSCLIQNKETGKRDNGFEIIKLK